LIIATALGTALAGGAEAQTPSLPSPTSPADFASVTGGPETFTQPTAAVPGSYTGDGSAPAAPIVEMGLFDTIAESICGKPDPNTWRPLTIHTLFTEGWNEAWVPSPNGSGGAPRQGWINAADGNFYRLWFFTFAQAFNQGPKGIAYLGAFTLYMPLSRRLLLITNIPFIVRNSAPSGLPIINPTGQPTFKSYSTFGDMSFTPRVLLHETKDFSLTSEMAVLVPTGNPPSEGKTTLIPYVSFWNKFTGRWVVRGGIGDLIPLKGGGSNTLISQLAIGHTFTDHDVPLFGDFQLYVSAVEDSLLVHGQHTSATLTPGMRTHLGNDWYFLAGLPTPVTTARIGDIGMIFWFMKAW
jgi:hypothetical protein